VSSAGTSDHGARRWLWLSLLVILLDQLSKQWASAALAEGMWVLFDVLNLRLAHNTGAAFSFLSGAGGWQTVFFVVLALAVSLWLGLWLWRLREGGWPLRAGLALILGGALGNVMDRVRFGYVVDFIDLHWRQWHWPVFNLADSAITVGVALLLWDGLRPERRA
jgi:signal peptidase II